VPSLPSVEVNDDFADVLENLDIALMALVEADNGRLYVRSDLFFASLTSDGSTPSDLFSGAQLNTETFNLSTAAGIIAHKSETSQLNLFAGGRLWNLNNELTFFPGVAPGRSVEADRTFITPIVGTSGKISLSDTVTATASASLGGFGISGADIEIGVSAGLGVDLSNSFGLTLGYRYLYLDYENDGFIYDLAQHGPLVGVQFRF
jgi:opacity protein-like surface antigen